MGIIYPRGSLLILNMLIIIWVNVTGGVATNILCISLCHIYLGVTFICNIEIRTLIHILDK